MFQARRQYHRDAKDDSAKRAKCSKERRGRSHGVLYNRMRMLNRMGKSGKRVTEIALLLGTA
jgi:hypothetical protein